MKSTIEYLRSYLFGALIYLPDVLTFLVVLLVVETAAICPGLVERVAEDSLVEVDFIREVLILANCSLFLDSCKMIIYRIDQYRGEGKWRRLKF